MQFSLVRDLAGFKQGTHSYKKGRNVLVQGAFTLEQRATVLELGADIWSTGATPFVVRSPPVLAPRGVSAAWRTSPR